MSWHGPGFIVALMAMCTIGWIITTAIRARHGYPITDDWGGTVRKDDPGEARKVQLLESENQRLTGKIGRLEERIAVLERIATDPAERTARGIEALR